MKISDQIRSAEETPKEQLQNYSQDYLGTEKDPTEELPVDEATEAEEADEIPSSEMDAITQGHKVVVDTGFLTAAEKKLLKRRGWRVVASPEVEADLTLKGYLEGVQKVLKTKFKAQTGGILKEVNKVMGNL
jgi:hypothetical protein